LTDLLLENFKNDVQILRTNSPLYVRCRFNKKCSANDLCKLAEKQGVLLISANTQTNSPEIAFSVATVGVSNFSEAVKILKNVVRNG
jgi:DNA-binding transcriptional MocR family regulator